jgi:uncharacterized protein (UPF0335 family)
MSNGPNKDEVLQYITRIEKLEEEKRATAGDIKDIYAEVKATGYDAKIIRKLVAIRRKSRDERKEEEALLELYMTAIGME